MDTILVVNAGSSSVKFQIFAVARGGEPARQIKGQIDGIGVRSRLRASAANGDTLIDRDLGAREASTVGGALQAAGAWLRDACSISPIAVGHRVVHGGPNYDRPVLIDHQVLEHLARYSSLAPLHQPNNLAPIRTLLERFPDLPQVACFDTAFHRGHSKVADAYAIPDQFYAEGVRRYGFHGLSYEYIAQRLVQVAPEIAPGRVIVAHLGSGASMCALLGGHSVESTLGFTALDGLPMGTRPGHLDPGVVLYLLQEKRMSAADIEKLFYHECGLKALSGISNDMRELESSVDPRAVFAIEYFSYRVALYAGMLAAALGGVDAFVFTAGIGENSARVRQRIAGKLGWLGAELDPGANVLARQLISRKASRPALYVIPTDEELMIARHTLALIGERRVAGATPA